MADNVKAIQMRSVPGKWQKLLMHLQNSPETAFRIVFPTSGKAAYARDSMRKALYIRNEWFSLLVTAQGCDVYVINTDRVQKVRIIHE